LEELVGIANRKDGAGEYLYSGYATLTRPFSTVGSTVQYAGDQGVRTLQTSPTDSIADGHNGFQVFQQVTQGNGTFVTRVATTNTGTGIIDTGNVANPTAWVPGNYTLQFTSPTAWQVVDSSSAVVTSGAYSSGAAITFNGAQVTVTGQPAAGDRFSIASSGSEDMFATISKLITTLGRPGATPADNAQFSTEMGAALSQLDNALGHTTGLRAEVGARLSVLDTTQSSRQDRELDLTTSLSQLRDLDYASAITQLNVQMAGLQAAQASYSKISQLSLFNYV
jgi:flagellar hook-associated protein 3 FlgL